MSKKSIVGNSKPPAPPLYISSGTALNFGDSPPTKDTPTSMMRVMAFLSLCLGGFLAFYGLYRAEDIMQLSTLVSVFVVPAFAGKVAQKHFETRGSK